MESRSEPLPPPRGESELARALGARIAKSRGSLSQSQFARHLGIHKNTLANYEQGRRLPDAGVLAKVTSLTGVNLEWLILGRQPVTPAAEEAGCSRSPTAPTAPTGPRSAEDLHESLLRLKAAQEVVTAVAALEGISLRSERLSILVDLVCLYGLEAAGVRRVFDLFK